MASQVVGVLVAVIVGIAAIGGVAWFVLGRDHSSSDKATSTETLPPAVELVTATGPDGSYSIGFPGRPDDPASLPAPNPGQQIMGWSEENAFDPAAGRGYLVISERFGVEVPPIYQKAALDAMGEQFGADPTAASIETTLLGYPARRYSFTARDGKPASGIAMVTSHQVYLIMAVGSSPDAERQAVEASFTLTQP